MPLPIAHGLVGATIVAVVYDPSDLRRASVAMSIGALLAIAPDLDLIALYLSFRGVHRGFSHSLACALFTTCVAAMMLGAARLREAAAYGLAVGSHGVLDFLTSAQGGGVKLFWPIGTRYKLGVWSFSEFAGGYSWDAVVWWSFVEAAVLLPLLATVLWFKRRRPNANCNLNPIGRSL